MSALPDYLLHDRLVMGRLIIITIDLGSLLMYRLFGDPCYLPYIIFSCVQVGEGRGQLYYTAS